MYKLNEETNEAHDKEANECGEADFLKLCYMSVEFWSLRTIRVWVGTLTNQILAVTSKVGNSLGGLSDSFVHVVRRSKIVSRGTKKSRPFLYS